MIPCEARARDGFHGDLVASIAIEATFGVLAVASVLGVISLTGSKYFRARYPIGGQRPYVSRTRALESTMRAIEIAEKNGPLELVERPLPEPKRGEVRVRVEACGICHTDILAVKGLFPGVTYPLIPGQSLAHRCARRAWQARWRRRLAGADERRACRQLDIRSRPRMMSGDARLRIVSMAS